MKDRWQGYYQATEGKPPRPTLLRALTEWSALGHRQPGHALDLGAGTGRDSLELLQQGWKVSAYDGDASGLAKLQEKSRSLSQGEKPAPPLDINCLAFEEISQLPSCDLINASFSLPFCRINAFDSLWSAIRQALSPGGLFCGQLLGPQDQWVEERGLLNFSADDLPPLFSGFRVIEQREEIGPGFSYKGEKFWHIWHLVLQRLDDDNSSSSSTSD
ncbi:class I SAM-dependent methyltransferase [Rhodovibrionaceae bacterium A322]